jgi:murein DD-endopeptidase MepM/ murein hydrolase activator NlpD
MKSLLLFLAGLLLGANVVYFLLVRPRPLPAPAPAAVAITTAEAPAQAAGPHPLSPPVAAAPPASTATTRPTPSTNPTPSPQAPSATPGTTSSSAPATAPTAAAIQAPGHLLIPVAGVAANQLQDTFGDSRGGGERAHEALDIMAPRGTPVLAASDGKLEKLFTSVPGGLTIYQFDPTRTYAYYYAHLDRYAPGIAEGSQLKRGELIGYVGSTGNASEDAPHLHFAIFVLGPEKRWWQGTAIDPYPLLGGR